MYRMKSMRSSSMMRSSRLLRSSDASISSLFGRRGSKSLAGDGHYDDSFQPPEYDLDREEISFLLDRFMMNPIFQEIPDEQLTEMTTAFEKVQYKEGTTIIQQGDTNGDFMIVTQEGKCSVTINGRELPDPYGTLPAGSMIGELALLYNAKRAATITAKSSVHAFRLSRRSFDYFVKRESKTVDLKEELQEIDFVIDKISGVITQYKGDIIKKYEPFRLWLWTRWRGTILEHSWRSALANMLVSCGIIAYVRFYHDPAWDMGEIPDSGFSQIKKMNGLTTMWAYLMTLTTFILAFFLAQAYGVWRKLYDISRRIQGRFSDIGLLVATTIERDRYGQITEEGEALIDDVASSIRMCHAFMWASVTEQFKCLLTRRGLSRMLSRGIVTTDQYSTLRNLGSGCNGYHYACMQWILIRCLRGMNNKTLPNDIALRTSLFEKITALRGAYIDISDLLDGRIPLAYVHFVQILVDSFLILAPFALYCELGVWSIPAVGLLTLFYSGLLDLAKILLDPLDNDNYSNASVNMDIGVLIRETNASSTQWKYASEKLPFSISSSVVNTKIRGPTRSLSAPLDSNTDLGSSFSSFDSSRDFSNTFSQRARRSRQMRGGVPSSPDEDDTSETDIESSFSTLELNGNSFSLDNSIHLDKLIEKDEENEEEELDDITLNRAKKSFKYPNEEMESLDAMTRDFMSLSKQFYKSTEEERCDDSPKSGDLRRRIPFMKVGSESKLFRQRPFMKVASESKLFRQRPFIKAASESKLFRQRSGGILNLSFHRRNSGKSYKSDDVKEKSCKSADFKVTASDDLADHLEKGVSSIETIEEPAAAIVPIVAKTNNNNNDDKSQWTKAQWDKYYGYNVDVDVDLEEDEEYVTGESEMALKQSDDGAGVGLSAIQSTNEEPEFDDDDDELVIA